ncbi:MAG: VCBS repeat-containing protein [Clostridiales bacterium]|nr:VCBS repeat-containing protein [Clostridiales bacterium]
MIKMKALFIGVFLSVFLCGCSTSNDIEEKPVFVLSSEKQEQYETTIETVLDSYYWKYDIDSILFFEGNIPDKQEGSEKFLASMNSGYDMEQDEGKNAVVATIELIHPDGEKAGLAYFYFIRNNLSGVYYVTANKSQIICSLSERNVFQQAITFSSYETGQGDRIFERKWVRFPENGFVSEGLDAKGRKEVVCLLDQGIEVYRFDRSMQRIRSISFASQGLVPISAVFYPGENGDQLAVLLGSVIESNGDEGEQRATVSEKVVFYDSSLNRKSEEILLDSQTVSCLGSDGDALLLFDDNKILSYEWDDSWKREKQYNLTHYVLAYKKTDLDNDGIPEYLMSSGRDFYLYRKDENDFQNIWRTHLAINGFYGNIYAGDLNGDGVKEVYIGDTNSTSIRYILTQKGFVSENEDILYGERYFVCDYNMDGKEDYVKMEDAENKNQSLYLSE